MRSHQLIGRVVCKVAVASTALATVVSHAWATPFSSDSTIRQSKRISSVGSFPTFKRTYSALTKDSKDLSFQSLPDGRLFLVFATADGTIDDLQFDGRDYDRCSSSVDGFGNPISQVYWVDKTADLPPVCLSVSDNGTQGNADSYKPEIGGPADDEGRYIAFMTDNTDTALWRGKSPVGAPQIMIHDRKFEKTWLSSPQCDAGKLNPNGPSYLWQLGEDGQKVIMTSAATNIIDNLSPKCSDPNGTFKDVFIRDGKTCNSNSLGECATNVLFDDYGLHAGDSVVDLLDEDSQNVWMIPDESVVVFDTLSTYPVHFNPDVRGKKDIYYYKDKHFNLMSQTQLALQSTTTGKTVVKNVGGPANDDSERPRADISGRYIVFESKATDLVFKSGSTEEYLSTRGKKQIFFHDYLNGLTEMISIGSDGVGGNGDSSNAWISQDARYIVFESRATNLLKGKTTTSFKNIFLYDRILKTHFLVSTGTAAAETGLDADATITHVSKEGLLIAYQSKASNVVPSTAINGGAGVAGTQHVYLASHNCPADTDGDKVPDCLDLCPTDLKKSEPGFCGCGKVETDTDADGTPDCIDACPKAPTKIAVGACGCDVPDTDSDGDGKADCVDACPNDPTKLTPGACGCGSVETDSDLDGTPDCTDQCPANPARSIKGSCDCTALKDEPGQCGCNGADTDSNKNGGADCIDPTVDTVPAVPRVVISRGGTGSSARYKIRIFMQEFAGAVKYSATLVGPDGTTKRSSTRNEILFKDRSAGRYTFKYKVGVTTPNSKERSVVIKLPGGLQSSSKK